MGQSFWATVLVNLHSGNVRSMTPRWFQAASTRSLWSLLRSWWNLWHRRSRFEGEIWNCGDKTSVKQILGPLVGLIFPQLKNQGRGGWEFYLRCSFLVCASKNTSCNSLLVNILPSAEILDSLPLKWVNLRLGGPLRLQNLPRCQSRDFLAWWGWMKGGRCRQEK